MIPKAIICHHSGGTDLNPLQDSSNYTVEQCNQDHKLRFDFKSSLGWWVGYQYFIDRQGQLTQCRLDTEEGAHTIGQNDSSIGICLAGNFDVTLPTFEQKLALKNLLIKKTKEWNIDPKDIYPHRHFASKTCYGTLLADSWAKELIPTLSEPDLHENAIIKEQLTLIGLLQKYLELLKTKFKK